MLNKKIGFIGCGNMGEALIKGILAKGLADKKGLIAYDISTERSALIKDKFGIRIAASNSELVSRSECIVLAVKPEQLEELLRELTRAFDPGHLLISIVAGITTLRIEGFIKAKVPVVRVMPNTPAMVGSGVSAISLGSHAKAEDRETASALFGAVGKVVEVKEELMDVVTAISGSGPAYFFYLIESLISAAMSHGLPEELARELANQTALGSAKMVLETGEDPKVLRKKVTSKGGTTEAAFGVFDRVKLGKIYAEAVDLAIKRSKELSGA